MLFLHILKKYSPFLFVAISFFSASAQINTDQVTRIGRNALYFEDYVLSIQYFNQVISAKPYLAQPYFFRGIAKYNLDDFKGAEADATIAIGHNPFITDAYELRGLARQNLGNVKGAVEDYDKILSMLPENRSILFNKALALEELKEYDASRSAFDALLTSHPNFDIGYIGRAQLNLATKDTVAAKSDIEKALSINKHAVNAYVMRADIAINSNKDYSQALEDMNEAIKLQPRFAGYFINRAFLRHRLDDYYGAMSDYDYALQLDPLNYVALYNRALLRSEVHDFNKAIDDLTKVINLRPNDFRALYNRAVVLREKGDYKEALEDVNKVIEEFPDLAAAYFLRFDIKRAAGMKGAEDDYSKSLTLAKQRIKKHAIEGTEDEVPDLMVGGEDGEASEAQETVAARFSSLLTVANNATVEQEFNNKDIRGKVQDRNRSIEIEPMFVLTYYNSPTELRPTGNYIREADELNRTHTLRYLLQVTNREASLDDPEEIEKHFRSIAYYDSYLASHTPRAVDYFGRAMDQMTVRNYAAAIKDLDQALAISPDFTLALLLRSTARYKQALSELNNPENARKVNMSITLHGVVDDLDKVIKQSPNMAIAYYNKGVALAELQDFTSALSAFTNAIELAPDFGEAYYNRGYVFFKLGNRTAGTNDLSKAGEMGVVPSYNLLKRMDR